MSRISDIIIEVFDPIADLFAERLGVDSWWAYNELCGMVMGTDGDAFETFMRIADRCINLAYGIDMPDDRRRSLKRGLLMGAAFFDDDGRELFVAAENWAHPALLQHGGDR